MKYYLLDTNGDVANPDLCFTDNEPKPIGSYHLSSGTRLREAHPEGVDKVTLQLGEDYPGLEQPSFLGNTDGMLIVKRATADLVLAHEVGETEQLPFVLLNHKKRPHADDYVFLNPIGTFDCLDPDRSQVKRHKDGSVMRVVRFVLSRRKVARAPQLFRPSEDPTRYILGESLVQDLRAKKCTNLVVTELEVV